MKLFYTPGVCSLASHIVSHEVGLPLELVKVDLKTKLTENGDDYRLISPKGYVPALQLDDGELLTEGAVIVQFLADAAANTEVLPQGRARYRVQELLNFLASELHKSFSPLFQPDATDEVKAFARKRVLSRLQMLEELLGDKTFLLGDGFSVADAYAFTVLNWTKVVGIDLADGLKAYRKRVLERPAVQKALAAEGLNL